MMANRRLNAEDEERKKNDILIAIMYNFKQIFENKDFRKMYKLNILAITN